MENTKSVFAQVALFNGKNMEGWLARGGASEHAWSAIGGVALNPDDNNTQLT